MGGRADGGFACAKNLRRPGFGRCCWARQGGEAAWVAALHDTGNKQVQWAAGLGLRAGVACATWPVRRSASSFTPSSYDLVAVVVQQTGRVWAGTPAA